MDGRSSVSVSVRFSQVKGCFLIIHRKYRQLFSSDINIFKIEYGSRTAFLSCGSEMASQKDVESKVFINAKYAEKLGLKDKEYIRMTPVLEAIPKATKVFIEPLTTDCWEIMSCNSEFIEKSLLNQIRVVWTNQVFPIWVNNLHVFATVVACLPDHNPVILEEKTYVSIIPKDRYSKNVLNSPDSDQNKSNYRQYEYLRFGSQDYKDSEISEIDDDTTMLNSDCSSYASFITAPSFISSFFSFPKEEKTFYEEGDSGDFYQFNFNSVLRVIPYTRPQFSLPTAVQATTVFISATTYIQCCGDKEIPPCFVGVLQKIPLPDMKSKKTATEIASKTGIQSTTNSLSRNESKAVNASDNKDAILEEQSLFESVCVTVMVIKSATPDEDEFILPKNLFMCENVIVVPKELKRGFNLDVASLVHLRSIDTKPLTDFSIVLHPVTDLDKRFTQKMVQENFVQWAFGKRKSHTYVVSNGTLVRLVLNEKICDFYMHLQEKDTKSNNSSGSGNSFDSDKNLSYQLEPDYAFLSYALLKRIPIKLGPKMCLTIVNDRPFLIKDSNLYQDVKASKVEDLGGIKEMAETAIEDIEFWLKLRPLSYVSSHSSTDSGCMLICGPKGVGKTAFALALCKNFVNYQHYVFIQSVSCLPLKGKRIDIISKKWDDIVSNAIYSQPSIILFEDLDYIASCPASQEQENGPDGAYFASVSQAFINMMNRITESRSKIAVIATAQSLHSLHSSLVNTRGRHIFKSVLEVNPPNAEQRGEILLSLMKQKCHISQKCFDNINLSEIAAKTEGYVAQDLLTMLDRATHAAWVRLATSQKADHVKLAMEDFDTALKSFVPASLRGISLQMQGVRTWNDVGGLKDVKKVIQQIIMWPTKYKQLYKNYSLKPQTNILLYGAPGTGKTLLAGVVASECGLNFISIKGPELLSKYIGASEQAVRDLFKRAMTARPCILFFDEFDSIAPRRGHDSTGVTDRVVNQLLTQLDGVESLEGVHVLAATSRPGLIDPALLRPGRLDKCLHCPLPDKEDRKEILQCLSYDQKDPLNAKLPLSNDIDFDEIASITEHFSGADLQALLYTAHIQALHDAQQLSSRRYSTGADDKAYSIASDKLLYLPSLEQGIKAPSYEDGKKIVHEVSVVQDKCFGYVEKSSSTRRNSLSVIITQRHLRRVADEMNPSVSEEERERYKTVFKKFQSALSGDSSTMLSESPQRVTLA